MKKVVLVFMLLTTITFGQTKQVKDSTFNVSNIKETEVERLIDKYGGKIIKSFEKVVEKATPVAEQGFKMTVRLSIAKGIGKLLPLIFGLYFLNMWFREHEKIKKIKGEESNVKDKDLTPKWFVSMIISFILLILALFNTYSGVLNLIAPEWFAIKDIINLLK